eukprot:gene14632-biopygen8743
MAPQIRGGMVMWGGSVQHGGHPDPDPFLMWEGCDAAQHAVPLIQDDRHSPGDAAQFLLGEQVCGVQ